MFLSIWDSFENLSCLVSRNAIIIGVEMQALTCVHASNLFKAFPKKLSRGRQVIRMESSAWTPANEFSSQDGIIFHSQLQDHIQ